MKKSVVLLSAVAVAAAAGGASAQFTENLEGRSASPTGVDLNGQNGWYLPAAGGVSHKVYNYAGNSLGVAANPDGGDNFAAGISDGSNFGRSQRDFAWPSPLGHACFDAYVMNNGTGTNNIGSFSLQPYPGSASAILLLSYAAGQVNNFQAGITGYNSTGGAYALNPIGGFAIQHWYRVGVLVDFSSNRVLELTVRDITGGTVTRASFSDMYLEGGAGGGRPAPTGGRMFSGAASNTIAWDNLRVSPAPGSAGLLVLAGLAASRRRR